MSSRASRDMRAFDALPASARRALREAYVNWSAPHLLARWQRGDKGHRTGLELTQRIKARDRMQHRADARAGKVAPL